MEVIEKDQIKVVDINENAFFDEHIRILSKELIIEDLTEKDIEKRRRQDDHGEQKVIFSAIEVGRCSRDSVPPLVNTTSMLELDDLFKRQPELEFVPVKNSQEKIIGYILAEKFRAFLGQSPYHRDIYLKPIYNIETVMDPDVVVLDSHMTLNEASAILMRRDIEKLYDPFVVTHKGQYMGVSTVKSVMDGLNNFTSRNMKSCETAQEAILEQPDFVDHEFIELYYLLEELNNLGGDLVFHKELRKDLYMVSAMDVSGKGLKASNMVNTIQSFFKSSFDLYLLVKFSKSKEKKIIMKLINRLNRMVANNTPFDLYATGVFFIIDASSGVMDYYDYGHTPIYLIRNDKILELPPRPPKESTGIPFFGIDPELVVTPNRIRIQSGDKIFVHSDGLDEARSVDGEEFGEDRLKMVLKENSNRSPQDMIRNVKDRLEHFRQGNRVLDDLTLLSFELKNITQEKE